MSASHSAGRAALALLLALLAGPARAEEVEVLVDHGPSANRIDLVILGDGYTNRQQDKLRADARATVAALFAFSPYKEYAPLFNVKLIHVISNRSGADNGTYGANRDTALGAYFNCFGIQRLLCVNDASVLQIAAANVPEFDVAMVVVNDPMYGGSGGEVPVLSVNPASPDIIRHELGHNFAHLADEYDAPYPGYPACDPTSDCPEPNATLRTTLAELKWAAWVDAGTPIPTPDSDSADGVGLFQGCRYETSGVYRPTYGTCIMNALGEPFCPVCQEALLESFWNRVHLVDSSAPASPVDLCAGPVTLSAAPAWAGALEVAWSVDGQPATGQDCGDGGVCLALDPAELGPGSHQVLLTARDATTLVRTDPNQLTTETIAWEVGCPLGDAGAGQPDAGVELDAGVVEPDAGQPVDAGAAPTTDAGSAPPASPAKLTPGSRDVLGCQAGPGSLALSGLTALGLLGRRRRLADPRAGPSLR